MLVFIRPAFASRGSATAFAGRLRAFLDWREYSIGRSLGERLPSSAYGPIAERAVRQALANLPRVVRSAERWTALRR